MTRFLQQLCERVAPDDLDLLGLAFIALALAVVVFAVNGKKKEDGPINVSNEEMKK